MVLFSRYADQVLYTEEQRDGNQGEVLILPIDTIVAVIRPALVPPQL